MRGAHGKPSLHRPPSYPRDRAERFFPFSPPRYLTPFRVLLRNFEEDGGIRSAFAWLFRLGGRRSLGFAS